MATSKLQRKVSQYLSEYFGNYTIRENTRPEWLLDSTGRRLELDFYIEELEVAVEVQGEQHYRYVDVFHKDYQGFLDQKERDYLKKEACSSRGIVLIEIVGECDLYLLDNLLPQESCEEKPVLKTGGRKKKKKHQPYIGIDKTHAIMFIKSRLEEIDRLNSLEPIPYQSIKNTLDSIKDMSLRYSLSPQDFETPIKQYLHE